MGLYPSKAQYFKLDRGGCPAVRLANFSGGLSSVRGRLAKGRWKAGNKTGGIKRKVLQQ